MKLNVTERLTILSILPKESDFLTLKIVRDLQASLGLNESEWKEFEIKQNGTNVSWNPEKGSIEKDIKIGEKAIDIIVTAFKELDKQKKLTAQHFSAYEKFIGGE